MASTATAEEQNSASGPEKRLTRGYGYIITEFEDANRCIIGGGPFGELMTRYARESIKATIVEEDRSDLALHWLGDLKDAIKDFNKHVSKGI